MEEKAVREETVELNYPSSNSSTEVDATDESDGESSSTIRSKEVMPSKDEHCYTTADCSPGPHQAH